MFLSLTGLSVRLLAAGDSCNVTGEYFEKTSMSVQKEVRLSNVTQRILYNKRRILRSPMPNEHPMAKAVTPLLLLFFSGAVLIMGDTSHFTVP